MGRRLLFNTALMTGASLLMRCIAMGFQGWLSGRIGAAGLGLYQLVMSVELLAATFAISGIRFAVTRIVSEELGLGRGRGVSGAMSRAAAYALMFGSAAVLMLTYFAERAGFLWIGDARTVSSLRILSWGLPCIALSSVLSGYFTACGRIWKPSLVHLIEQGAVVLLCMRFLSRTPEGDVELSCAAVCAGVTCADVLSAALMLAFYAADRRKYGGGSGGSERLTLRLLGTALPLAVSAYARSALSTLEHLLVPRGLRRSGLSADAALAGYGVIQGMAMPAIGFPACLLTSLAENAIPGLTAAQVRGRTEEIRREVRALLLSSAAYALGSAALLYALAPLIGEGLYSSPDCAGYIRLLCPLVPAMYIDTVVDGCLKGLGQQVWSMGINILDAALGVVLVYCLLPGGALGAYIGIIYFNELLNLTLSALRLRRCLRLARG